MSMVTRHMIDASLLKMSDPIAKGPLKDAIHYALKVGGKRIRPLLFCKVLESYGIDPLPYIEVASSIEMIHTYSLIHDDLPAMDNDDLRRNQPTVHTKFDEATAILAGDALLTDAFKILAHQTHIQDTKRIKLVEILAENSGSSGMVYGQSLDLLYETKKASIEILKEIHTYKTARLIQAPMMMAAVIANENDDERVKLIGEMLGVAFQMQDDVLDATSDQTTMGKTLSDERNQKSTYITLIGLEETQTMISNLFDTIDKTLKDMSLKTPEPLLDFIDAIKTRKK